MRRSFMVLITSLLILIATTSVAIAKSVHVTLGNYEYDIKRTVSNDYNPESGFNYHYGSGSVYTGFYTTTYSKEHNLGYLLKGLPYDEFVIAADEIFDDVIGTIISSSGISTYEIIDINVDSYVNIMPHRAIHFEYPGDDNLSMFMYVWIDWDYIYMASYSNPMLTYEECQQEFTNFLNGVIRIGANKNSRKNPACVGDTVTISLSRNGLDYTLSLTIDEFYRGDAYTNLLGKNSRQAEDGYEYVAVKATVKFESIDSIIPSSLGTDDPKIDIGAIADFKSYSSTGMEYDNINYSIAGKK